MVTLVSGWWIVVCSPSRFSASGDLPAAMARQGPALQRVALAHTQPWPAFHANNHWTTADHSLHSLRHRTSSLSQIFCVLDIHVLCLRHALDLCISSVILTRITRSAHLGAFWMLSGFGSTPLRFWL